MRMNPRLVFFSSALLAVLASSQAVADPVATFQASVAEGVDRLLASQLFDPTTAIQYRVSAPVACKNVMDGLPDKSMCVCYSVNAKNRFGAYAGSSTYVAPYMEVNGQYLVLPGLDADEKEAGTCEKIGMAVRPASKIADFVSK